MKRTYFVVAFHVVTMGVLSTVPACDCSPSSGGSGGGDSGTHDGSSADGPEASDGRAAADGSACAKHLPPGFTVLLASTASTNTAAQASMALDENDDPMFAYWDLSGDESAYFVRW